MIATLSLLGARGGRVGRSITFSLTSGEDFTWTSSRAKSTKWVLELILPKPERQ